MSRRLISNLLISFLQLSRGDTKKFEVLQLLAGVLSWDDDEKELAGLQRSHSAQSHLTSPRAGAVRRVLSSTNLNIDDLTSFQSDRREVS